ncbi:MAG TPA: AIR synthase family protein [Chloroflexota bacterium]|nr:AIR synthase family protein [Chloroflexota bacterium]
MRTGKLDPETLQRLVLGRLGVRRDDVVVHARLGEDAAAVAFGDEVCVLTSDPITGTGSGAGWYGVHIACNDVAAMGARPVGVLATLLFPASADEGDVRQMMEDVHRAALELGIEVLGGHTEVAPGLTAPIIAMAAVGRAKRGRLVTSAGARPNDALVLTKSAALEGTAILATDLEDHLRERLAPATIAAAQALSGQISVVQEGILAAELGATALHDPTEGGLLGAVWELAEASGTGYEVEAEAVPILDETRQVCGVFGADPLRLISSGALLIACPDAERMISGLRDHGIAAGQIGRVTKRDRVLLAGGQRHEVGPVVRDELWRILDELNVER